MSSSRRSPSPSLRTRALGVLGAAAVSLSLLSGVATASTANAAPATKATTTGVSVPTAGGSDPTVTRAARTSRASRGRVSVRAWANSATARRVAHRESGGNCRAVSPGGTYRGKWQMNRAFWNHYGGRRYASTADRASCAQQDVIAHRGWVDRWWRPWSTF